MTPSKFLSQRSSFESIRKQAKKLVRQFNSGDTDATARVHAQLTAPNLPLTLRDAQLVLAREYGFAGWKDLRAAVLRQEGKGLEWAVAEAERAIHDNSVERLAKLIQEYPMLLSWRGDNGESLLKFATDSFGDSGDPWREQMFTRIECAEFLLDAGAVVHDAIWDGAISARAKGVLQLLSRKGVLPRTLNVLAAMGDYDGVRDFLGSKRSRPNETTEALFCACRFQHQDIAALLLNRCIERDPTLGERVEKWRGRSGFIDYLSKYLEVHGDGTERQDPWQIVVMSEVFKAIAEDDLQEFNAWFQREPDLLRESHLEQQERIVQHAVFKNRPAFVTRMLEVAPLLALKPPPHYSFVMALDYANAHLVPLLTRIWPLPNDLCHAAGVGDFTRVKSWFDDAGGPKLGSLGQHYPTNNSWVLGNLRWTPPNAQQILDTAFAWACINKHFDIASFLLERGANINTDWSTHEPASILHECAVHGNYETAQFLIDHGIDMTTRDYRWNGTAEGWAYYAANDKKMAEFLREAERARKAEKG